MKLSLYSLMLSMTTLALLGLIGPVQAQITTVTPFTGTEAETWESFDNYDSGGFHKVPEPATIFSGAATITSANRDMLIYELSTNATFGLGTSGSANVSDGTKGMGLNSFNDSATITFATAVSTFGAYWGANTENSSSDPAIITVSFYDANHTLIDTSQSFNYSHSGDVDGNLDWHGFASTTPIGSVTYSGDFVVTDGLQANVASTPEPGTYALLASSVLTGAAFLRRRRNGCKAA